MKTQPPPLPKIGAIGCTVLIIGLVASLLTAQWQWMLLAAAGFLTACVWAAAERRDDD